MKQKSSNLALWLALAVPVAWLAAVLADLMELGAGLDGSMERVSMLLSSPLAVSFNQRTLPLVLMALVVYAGAVYIHEVEQGKKRTGEEHGSAQWGKASAINAKYMDRKHKDRNILLTDNIQMGLDGRKHRRNLNVLVVGGSGAGKTFFYAKPNIMQCNCSYIIADPKGEILRSVGHLLENEGYEITVFDLIQMRGHYNPFAYLRDDASALKLITNLIKNTTPKGANQSDPFWDKAETALLSALILYLKNDAIKSEQNFSTVMMLLGGAEVREDDEEHQSPLDLLFDSLAEKDPDSIALKQYRIFKQAAGKTAKSILVSAAVRLAAFNLPEVAAITDRDEMDFGSLGERKRAIFAIIPDSDASLNYLVGMMYTQAFQELYYKADFEYGGRLPVHVRLIMDEFANIAMPDDFERLLATMRSREISVSIIIQNLAQLKSLFKDSWENITGNCDTLLYLGGNEQSTHKYMSEMLGKATIDTKTRGLTKGRNGSSSENFQNAGRELMTPDEVRAMDNEYALVFIRGEPPVCDKKYNILRHPNVRYTEHGSAGPYSIPKEPGDYTQNDLSFRFESLDKIQIIE